ncbi:MAG: DUF4105 domain-containing protein [Muribaculaceae bacterium]|nr:DUF4105 domain-containing protein [Muribaculaceae bacterium]
MIRKALLLILCFVAGFVLSAQSGGGGDSLRISLVTVYPGEEIYELEGHSALRVQGRGYDTAVNFGLFDFDAPNFVWRFVKGETDYMVGAYPWHLFVESYAGSGRRIVEQPLDLPEEMLERMVELLQEQLTPPNNVYRYNYVLDNCATRPRSIVMEGGRFGMIQLGPISVEGEGAATFREAMRVYHRNYPWYQFGIDLALGKLIDEPISSYEQMFAPVALMEGFDGSGLVGEAEVVAEGRPGGATAGPTPWFLTPMAFALAVLAAAIGVSVRDYRRGRLSRGFDAVLFGVYGIAGLVLAFLVFVSEHYATSPNYLIWWLNPFCLIPTIFIWSKKTINIVFCYQCINFVVLIGLIIAWPFCGQSSNPAIWPLIVADLIRSCSFTDQYSKQFKDR